MVLALSMPYLSDSAQQTIAGSLRATVLIPFLALQESLTRARVRAGQVDELIERLDALTARASTRGALLDENRTLRELLDLAGRVPPTYRPATLLRPGTPGSESMFMLDLGLEDGVRAGAPVLSPEGLVGRILEARGSTSVGMDWTHPDFRASAMLEDGGIYGIVENRKGDFREVDRLVLNGAAYNEIVFDGTMVVTSGLGGVFPRGIPIGRIDGVAEVEGSWRKSYWLRPQVQPGAVTHVLVATGLPNEALGSAWRTDSVAPALGAAPHVPDSLAVAEDSAAAAGPRGPQEPGR
jgi:rod shape-determining protein MreC